MVDRLGAERITCRRRDERRLIPAIPIGAFVAERLGHPNFTMLGWFLLTAAEMAALPSVGDSVALVTVIGILLGPAAGLIMVLPGQTAPPERRAPAMGEYFTCYYVGMGVASAIAGFARDATGSPAAPIYVASGMLLAAVVAFPIFTEKGAAERRLAHAAPFTSLMSVNTMRGARSRV
jgi:predicted MFS family arabinose efflux permease